MCPSSHQLPADPGARGSANAQRGAVGGGRSRGAGERPRAWQRCFLSCAAQRSQNVVCSVFILNSQTLGRKDPARHVAFGSPGVWRAAGRCWRLRRGSVSRWICGSSAALCAAAGRTGWDAEGAQGADVNQTPRVSSAAAEAAWMLPRAVPVAAGAALVCARGWCGARPEPCSSLLATLSGEPHRPCANRSLCLSLCLV